MLLAAVTPAADLRNEEGLVKKRAPALARIERVMWGAVAVSLNA
jgi:hypothetical protein